MNMREIYSNAPLRLVSLEIKFPVTSRILTRSLWDALEEGLGQMMPEVHAVTDDPDSNIPRNRDEPVLRRISSDHKRAVTLYVEALTIELADYRRYEDLKDLVTATLAAFSHQTDVLRPTRMGLRCINEVKATAVNAAGDEWQSERAWASYINRELLNAIQQEPDSLCAFTNRGSIYFHSKIGDEQASLDYGIHPGGMVDPDDVLRLGGPSGPCFVLDIDAFNYRPPQEATPDSKELMRILDGLHNVVETIFQWSITDRLREVFRAPVQDNSGQQPLLSASGS